MRKMYLLTKLIPINDAVDDLLDMSSEFFGNVFPDGGIMQSLLQIKDVIIWILFSDMVLDDEDLDTIHSTIFRILGTKGDVEKRALELLQLQNEYIKREHTNVY